MLKDRYPGVRLRSRDPIAEYLPDRVTRYVDRDRGLADLPDRDPGHAGGG